jgi:hypothetical protein
MNDRKLHHIIKEAIQTVLKEGEGYSEHIYYEYLDKYDPSYVFRQFLETRGEKQSWTPLINPSMYQKALSEFTRFGRLDKFPTKYIYQWMGIIMKNTAILKANTDIAGHSQYFPSQEFEDFLQELCDGDEDAYSFDGDTVRIRISEEEFLHLINKSNSLYEENGIHPNGQYDLFMNQDEVDDYEAKKDEMERNADLESKFRQYERMAQKYNYDNRLRQLFVDMESHTFWKEYDNPYNFLFDDGMLEGWMVLPDGSDAFSDFGIEPIQKYISQYHEGMSAEDTLVLINKILDVVHCRGDLASAYIQGGKQSLYQASNGVVEGKKKVYVTEEQLRKLCKRL